VSASKYIGHIPKVLYHWRVIESSTALSIETKPYALAGQRKAVDNYMASQNIPATSYHEMTELFLSWNKDSLDSSPVVFIKYTNLPNTLRVMRSVRRFVDTPRFAIIVDKTLPKHQQETIERAGCPIVRATNETTIEVIDSHIGSLKNITADTRILILRDSIKFTKNKWYEMLTGWLAIDDVYAVSGRLVDKHDLIVDSGGLITPDYHYFPLFCKYPKYYQSYLGNAEWVRNLSAISSNFVAIKRASLKEYLSKKEHKKQSDFNSFITWVGANHRIVLSPQATAMTTDIEGIMPTEGLFAKNAKIADDYQDPFGNPNMSKTDPLRLFDDEPLVGINRSTKPSLDQYQHDAMILASTFDISQSELEANAAIVNDKTPIKPQSVAWILPSYEAVYAGLMNIFSFANYLAEDQGLTTTFYILKDRSDASSEKKQAVAAFPRLSKAKFVGIRPDQTSEIGTHDIGIATQWATAYPLAKTLNIKRKWYFIQDNEVNFYPKGSISSLVELSYKFGFKAIANTEGLLDMYKRQYGGDGIVVKSVVDLSKYYPRKDIYYTPKPQYKVFFYARPNMPRNAFELGIAGLKVLKKELGSDVEVITAGAEWDTAAYGVEGLFTNLGKVEYSSVPKLYRSVDAGLMFMFSGHPGVTASELMASGCPVVVNEYEDKTWHELYKHEETCLVSTATASEVARNLSRLLEEPKLRKKLIDNGLKLTKTFYSDYEGSSERGYKELLKK
jgi:glycosyltransferase involved in cell wall biosynthesis